MRNLIKVGLALAIAAMVGLSACGSSNNNTGTGGSSGAGGATGTGGSGTDSGTDVPSGTGGSDGGGSGTGGAAPNAHQDHLNIINKATTGGMTVSRPAPVPYDSCKI